MDILPLMSKAFDNNGKISFIISIDPQVLLQTQMKLYFLENQIMKRFLFKVLKLFC